MNNLVPGFPSANNRTFLGLLWRALLRQSSIVTNNDGFDDTVVLQYTGLILEHDTMRKCGGSNIILNFGRTGK